MLLGMAIRRMLLLLLPHALLIELIGIIPSLIPILMSHIHGRGHSIGIPMTLIVRNVMVLLHEVGISAWSSLHGHARAHVLLLLLAGVASVGIGVAPHLLLLLGHSLLLLLVLLLLGVHYPAAIVGAVAAWRHLALLGGDGGHLTTLLLLLVVRGLRLAGRCALVRRTHLLLKVPEREDEGIL